MKQIEDLLRRTMGLHAATISATLIEDAVRDRMRDLNLTDAADYLNLLCASEDEWQTFVESVVVTETWFFRDHEPFRALIHFVQHEWLPAHPNGQLRILSLPCSTGEEPYSIAMALLDAGIPAAHFKIDAFDLRPNAITHARRAEYGKNSFRGNDLEFRATHFQATANGHSLNAPVREQVHFQTGNLLDEQCLAQTGVYDFIFCRNLLIYFDRPTQEQALHKLDRLLTPAGLLFVGSAEVTIASHSGFVSANLPLSFACRKIVKENTSGKLRPSRFPRRMENGESETNSPASFPIVPERASDDLNQAAHLVSEGHFAEAVAICENFLRQHGASADAYYLMGLARETAGAEPEAAEFYRKALYLEPNHYATLRHWASLSERNGDDAHARILNQRAVRIKKTELEAP